MLVSLYLRSAPQRPRYRVRLALATLALATYADDAGDGGRPNATEDTTDA